MVIFYEEVRITHHAGRGSLPLSDFLKEFYCLAAVYQKKKKIV